jgi:hypothetical protein
MRATCSAHLILLDLICLQHFTLSMCMSYEPENLLCELSVIWCIF